MVWRRRRDEDFADEVRSHLEHEAERLHAEGLTQDAAQAAARRAFGNVTRAQERFYDGRRVGWLDDGWRDLRYAWRSLRHDLRFTGAAVLILAVGIAANTAVFSVADAVLLRPLPYPDADRLVALRSTQHGRTTPDSGMSSAANLADWQAQATSFEAIAGYAWRSVDLRSRGDLPSERLRGLLVTPEYFDVFSVVPAAGRVFTASDLGTRAIVLGHRLWRDRFGADTRLVGSMVDVNMINLNQSGATPNVLLGAARTDEHFPPLTSDFNLGEGTEDDTIDFWLPASPPSPRRESRGYDVVAKLRPGVTVARAQAEMDAIARHLAEAFPATNKDWGVDVVPLRTHVVGQAHEVIALLSLGTGLVLLIACGNVATLCLVRGLARTREFAVRVALGASRGRLARQLVTESMLLAMGATVLGTVGGEVALIWLKPWFPSSLPFIQHVSLDRTVLAFVVTLAAATVLLTGVVPALAATAQSFGGTGLNLRQRAESPWHRRLVDGLTALQTAITIVLLVCAGLLLRSAQRLWHVNPGFNASHVLTLTISLPANKFDWEHNVVFERDVTARVQRLGGVQDASVVQGVPMRVGGFWTTFSVDGMAPAPAANHPSGHLRVVGPGYFQTLQIPVLDGRDFDARDDVGERGRPRFLIVNHALASHFWPHESAVGKRLRQDYNTDWVTIAGVVGDVRYDGLDTPPDFEMYLPDGLFPESAMTLLVRTAGDPRTVIHDVRDQVASVDREAFISDVASMDDLMSQSVASRSFATLLLSLCALVAAGLALSGIYGIVAQAAAQRRTEIGIRIALGADTRTIIWWMLRRTLPPVALGGVMGILAAAASARLLRTLLFDVRPFDLPTYLAMIVTFGVVAGLASLIPAQRAVRADPLRALRCE